MIRIVLVDDDPAVRHGLKMRLGLTKDVRVVGEAGTGGAALPLIRELAPDVVVMDIELPDCNGISLTRAVRAEVTGSVVVILSMHDDPATRERAAAAGAGSFVGKHEGITALLAAIRNAAAPAEHDCPCDQKKQRSMSDFYDRYYAAVRGSRAHAAFCEYAYGRDLSQHGMATMEQLDKLIEVTGLNTQSRALDLGCGNGMIAGYISDLTGAHITGIDYNPRAIADACERTQADRSRLEFLVGDMESVDLAPASFDTLLSIDTIYFCDDYAETIRRWQALLKDGGQMAVYFSYGVDPEHPKETFDVSTLAPDKTPLARALELNGLDYRTWDFTGADYALAKRKIEALERLKADFDAEGNSFLYENRAGEAQGTISAVELGMHARYLYHIRK